MSRRSREEMCLYGSVVDMKEALKREEDSEPEDIIREPVPPREHLMQRRRRSRARTVMLCDECEETSAVAKFYCSECELSYCASCDEHRHRKGRLKLHERSKVDEEKDFDASNVRIWLQKIDMLQYFDTFCDISNSELLRIASEDVLETQFKISMRLHRKKLFREIQKLRTQAGIQTPKQGRRRNTVSVVTKVPAITSPVAAHRARVVQGQTDWNHSPIKRRLNQRSPSASSEEEEKAIENNQEVVAGFREKLRLDPEQMGAPPTRRPQLALDLDNVASGLSEVRSSFHFSAEGTFTTAGFEIHPGGIADTPFARRGSLGAPLQTKDCLVMLNELGQGAGGKVYKALHVPTLKLVAVKMVRLYDKNKRHQMVRELKSLYANIVSIGSSEIAVSACRNLVSFYDAYTNPDKGTVSIVLEYMDAGSLENVLDAGNPCSEAILANIAHSTLKGLAFLHDRHLLHRDIKPSNILMTRSGDVKISDFGISRDLESTAAKATTFTGTLMYMAPERISGGKYSYPSDMWSLGLSIFACAIGRMPLPVNDGYWGVVHAVQQLPSPKLEDYGTFSRELCDFMDHFLKKDPSQRPSASQLLSHPFLRKHMSASAAAPPLKDEQQARQELEMVKTKYHEWHASRHTNPPTFDTAKYTLLAKQLGLSPETVAAALNL